MPFVHHRYVRARIDVMRARSRGLSIDKQVLKRDKYTFILVVKSSVLFAPLLFQNANINNTR